MSETSTDSVVATTKEAGNAELERRRDLALRQGGERKVDAHHAGGRYTARERIELLLGNGRFVEVGMLAHSDRPEVGERAPADAVIVGVGELDGRKVAIIAIDATVFAGTNGRVGMRKQAHINYLAAAKGYPLIVLGDSDGGRIPDLLGSGFAEFGGGHAGEHLLGLRHVTARIPRVTAILGNSYGDPSLYGAASDCTVMLRDSAMGISGPPLIEASIGESVTDDELAGPDVAANTTGVADLVVDDEPAAMTAIARFLSYLPSSAGGTCPSAEARPPTTEPDQLYDIVPDRFTRAYDMHKVIDTVVDADSYLELRPRWGRSLLTGLARFEGAPIGIVASQPMFRSGVLDDQAAVKARELIDLCDAFRLPVVFLQDIPGVLIGSAMERDAILRHVMDLFTRLATTTVPTVTVIIRKAYGLGWALLGGSPMGTDYVVAWPNSEIGFMAPDAAVNVLHRRHIAEMRAQDGDQAAIEWAAAQEGELHRENAPWTAASRAFLHDVIRPEDTRRAISDGLFLGRGYLTPTTDNAR